MTTKKVRMRTLASAVDVAKRFCMVRFLRWGWLAGLALGMGFTLAAGSPPGGDDPSGTPSSVSAASSPNPFKICKDQTYALCAVSRCFVFNEVSYCKCDVKFGDSIGLPFEFDAGQDVCTVNARGAANGYMVSTFSVPDAVIAPKGDQAIYTCPAKTSDGAYAQCDGGICFTSTEGQSFPGFDQPLEKNQIICSCPITTAHPKTAKVGYQIAGPYPCQKSFFENCKRTTANSKTGSMIYVGAPTGTAQLLSFLLTGTHPTTNECPSPRD